MKILLYITLLITLTACQNSTKNQLTQQYDECNGLIQKYFKAKKIGQYQLYQIEPNLHVHTQQRVYTYKEMSDSAAKFDQKLPDTIEFQCQKNPQKELVLTLLMPKNQQPILNQERLSTSTSTLAFQQETR